MLITFEMLYILTILVLFCIKALGRVGITYDSLIDETIITIMNAEKRTALLSSAGNFQNYYSINKTVVWNM